MDHLTAARIRALEIAIENAPNGAKWDAILDNADRFARFIITGKPEATK